MSCLAELEHKSENTIGARAIDAMKEKAKAENIPMRDILDTLDISKNVYASWKKKGINPGAYFLKQFALNGYDVNFILTGCNVQKVDIEHNLAPRMTIGERAGIAIKEFASKSGKSIRYECRKLGIDHAVIQRWQKYCDPSGRALQNMALRGYDVYWILTGKEK